MTQRPRPKPSKPPPVAGESLSQGELASCFGVSQPRISALTKDGTLLLGPDGRYPLRENCKRMVALLRKRGAAAGARERKLDLEAQLLAMKLDRERAELIERSVVVDGMTAVMIHARQHLLSIPSRVSPRIAFLGSEQAIQAELDSELRQALSGIVAAVESYEKPNDPINPAPAVTRDSGSPANQPASVRTAHV